MISGHDAVIRHSLDAETAFDHIVRVMRYIWPGVIVENGDTGAIFSAVSLFGDSGPQVYSGVKEIMLYQDYAAWDAWRTVGLSDRTKNKMIHVLAGWNQVTVVVDDPAHPDAKQFIEAMQSLLEEGHKQ